MSSILPPPGWQPAATAPKDGMEFEWIDATDKVRRGSLGGYIRQDPRMIGWRPIAPCPLPVCAMMTRKEALGILGALWDADSDVGSRLLVELVARVGYEEALTTPALIALAQRQQGEEMRLTLAAERKHREAWGP